MDFGLKEQKITHVPEAAGTKNALKDDLGNERGERDKEIGEHQICEKLQSGTSLAVGMAPCGRTCLKPG